MRMHKKGHLEERLLSCADILTVCDLSDKNMKSAAAVKDYLDFEQIFKNANPVHLEIGCGKGKFICEKAAMQPCVNFVACEKVSNVIIDACERAKRGQLQNLHFLNSAAEVLERYFKNGTVEKIYLNFSNPLPKEGYKKQRLTHPKFLGIYRNILKDGGTVIQKTDDRDFYLFSLESYGAAGYKILETDENYLAPADGDVETEHEILFKERGKNIYRIIAGV